MDYDFESTEEFTIIYTKLLDYLAARDYSEKKLLQKMMLLKKNYPQSKRYKGFNERRIQYCIDKLKKEGAIDEERSVRHIIHSSLSGIYGLRRVQQKLFKHGYRKEIILRVFEEFKESEDEPDYTRIIEKTKNRKESLENKYKGDEAKLRDIRSKLVQFLSHKGFNYDEILIILNEVYD